MRKRTYYSVEKASDIVTLQKNVDTKIQQGWHCLGGVAVSYVPRHVEVREVQYVQAMSITKLEPRAAQGYTNSTLTPEVRTI